MALSPEALLSISRTSDTVFLSLKKNSCKYPVPVNQQLKYHSLHLTFTTPNTQWEETRRITAAKLITLTQTTAIICLLVILGPSGKFWKASVQDCFIYLRLSRVAQIYNRSQFKHCAIFLILLLTCIYTQIKMWVVIIIIKIITSTTTTVFKYEAKFSKTLLGLRRASNTSFCHLVP